MVNGVQLPTRVYGYNVGLAGALPPSLGELGLQLTDLDLGVNDITSVPAELAALRGLAYLDLDSNQLTGLPTEFRTWGPVKLLRFVRQPGLQLRQRRRRDLLLHRGQQLRRRPARRAVLHRVTSSPASAPAVAPRPGRGDLARKVSAASAT